MITTAFLFFVGGCVYFAIFRGIVCRTRRDVRRMMAAAWLWVACWTIAGILLIQALPFP